MRRTIIITIMTVLLASLVISTTYEIMPENDTTSIVSDGNKIWVGTENEGVVVINNHRNIVSMQHKGILTNTYVSAIDRVNDEIIAGTDLGATVVRVEPANNEYFPVSDGSTNFSAIEDLSNVADMTLANSYGIIEWDNNVYAKDENYSKNVIIGDKFVSVNSSGLDPTINASATVTLKGNINCQDPILFAEGHYTTKQGIVENGFVCDANSNPSCTDIVCNAGTNVTFTTTHFTGYASDGNTNLTIYDENEGGEYNCNNDIVIFANYTTNDGTKIDGATCNLTIMATDEVYIMEESSTNYNYTVSFPNYGVTGSYDYYIVCNKTGYQTLNAYDGLNMIDSPSCGDYQSGTTAIPEFSEIGLLVIFLVLGIIVMVIIAKRKK